MLSFLFKRLSGRHYRKFLEACKPIVLRINELEKSFQQLTDEQLRYAASDVLHLHALRARLDDMLAREGRNALAAASFEFLPSRALLDLAGWAELDIFQH